MPEPFAINIDEPIYEKDVAESKVTVEMMGMKGSSVSTAGFLKALGNDLMPETGLLPRGVRWISRSRKIWLFEEPPSIKTISYKDATVEEIEVDDPAASDFDLPMPWLGYLVDLDQTYYPDSIFVYTLQGPINNTNNKIGILPLGNFSSGGRLCQPPRGDVKEQPRNIGEGLSLAYRMVWESGFNRDLDAGTAWAYHLRQPEVITQNQVLTTTQYIQRWSTLSPEVIASIKDWPWPRHNDRYIGLEDIQYIAEQGESYYQSRVKHGNTNTVPLHNPLKVSLDLDVQRRADWGAQGIQMAMQAAVSGASLYD